MSYNPRKAAQVIAYFIGKNGGVPISVLKVIKLVYLADRKSLEEWGVPILDELRVSMPHGPVNSLTYSFIQGEKETDGTGWHDFLAARTNHEVGLAENSGRLDSTDELSKSDINVMDEVWETFGKMGKWEIRDWTHDPKNLPEWEDPNGSSSPIPLRRILEKIRGHEAVEETNALEEILSMG